MRRNSDTSTQHGGSSALGDDGPHRSLRGAQEVDGRGRRSRWHGENWVCEQGKRSFAKKILRQIGLFWTGWATFVAMEDAFEQFLYRAQVEVAREVLRAQDLLIDLEKVTLHLALNKEWKAVSDLNIGIVEALKLKQPVLVAIFIARHLGEVTASEKAGATRTAHALLKGSEAMWGKGEFEELASWSFLPRAMVRSEEHHQRQPTPPQHVSGGFGGGAFSSGTGDFGSTYIGGAYGGGVGHASGGPGHYGPTKGRSHRGRGERGGRGGRGVGSGRAPTVCRKCTLAASTSTNHPHTICPLYE